MANLSLHALVLAAGQGTRMKSALAKVLHPVLGRPMLSYPLALARELGCETTVVVIGHQADSVRAAFSGVPVRFALQAEQKGTGHAVLCARNELPASGTVLILTGDTPLLRAGVFRDFLTAHRQSGAVISVLAANYPDPAGYGRVVVDAKGHLVKVVEHRDASDDVRKITLCNTGMYLADIPRLFRLLEQVRPDNAQGEYYLPDVLALARQDGLAVGVHTAPAHDDFLGVNDRVQLSEAARILQQRIIEGLQRGGVTVQEPFGTYVESTVTLGADTTLEAGVRLMGDTRIGPGCRIEQGSRIENARIAAGVHIRAYSILEDADVAPGCVVGPFARLRPGTVLEENAHVGNFVETKKTRLGKGSKANHLTYLGDADVGSGVNVGAGTITCNYDGVNKHKTIIGDGAFIGSDTQLVAPVRVGKNAVVGAGTTVTRDVPDGALSVSRIPQKDVEGYAARKAGKKSTPK